jgi:DNA-binding NarL/FixJ family response regulator
LTLVPTDTLNSTIRIVIADDHPIFRDGLRKLLESEPGFSVVSEAADGNEAVALVERMAPDVLLLDLAMPKRPGLDALRDLANGPQSVRTILLTAAIEKTEIVKALQLGARGIVLKEVATELLFKCIRCVMRGEYWVGRESVADLVEMLQSLSSAESRDKGRSAYGLTKREQQIVQQVVAGLTNRDIARHLGISEDTVKHHVTNVFNKVGVSTRLELALFAVHKGLIQGD